MALSGGVETRGDKILFPDSVANFLDLGAVSALAFLILSRVAFPSAALRVTPRRSAMTLNGSPSSHSLRRVSIRSSVQVSAGIAFILLRAAGLLPRRPAYGH